MNIQTESDFKVFISSSVVQRKEGDKLMLLSLDVDSHYFHLNGVAAEMCELLGQGKTFQQVVTHIESTHNVAREQVENDLRSLVHSLVQNQLAELG